jgi:hypothetical protein
VSAGAATPVAFETESTVGMVSGTVTLNGLPGNNLVVCVLTGYTGPNNDQWTPAAMQQCGYVWSLAPYNGGFRFLVPNGCGNGTVKGPSGNLLGSFSFCTEAGEETDVGNPVEPEDDTAPIVTPMITGTEGSNGWYTSDVSVTWTVLDEESDVTTPACAAGSVTSNTTGTTFACTATSAGGTAAETVTIKRDATEPTIAYAGNAGTYTVDQTVAITCSASDDMSGVASSTCAPVSGAAYGFTIGANSVGATATDSAGNSSSASAAFTVTVTHASVCTLVERWVSQHGVANSLCVKLRNAERGVGGGGDALRPFVNEVQAQSGKHVPADKAALLIELARAI